MKMIIPAWLYKASILGIFITCTSVVIAQKIDRKSQPNILIIQTDDMGYDDMSFHGRKDLETPNLDELATQSVRFTDFTVCSVCAPTRASFLTGRHFLKTGVAGVHGGHDFVNLDETLMPELFKKAGYTTGIFGKWHSGKTDGYFPWDRGFDQAYMAKLYQYFPSKGMFNDKPVTENRWSTEVIADYAINFIRQNKDKKFFAYVPFFDPHGLWRAPDDRVKKYQDKGLATGYATVCAMVDFLDENIGRLLAELNKQGLAENTIVVFLSDNGPLNNDKHFGSLTDAEWQHRNPSGYPGWKATNWSNGVKSPLFFRWPNHYKPADVSRLVDVTDMLPTLLDIAGIEGYKTNKPLDGHSFKTLLNNNLNPFPERKVYMAKWFAQVGKEPGESFKPISDDIRMQIKFQDQDLAVRDEHFKLMMNPNHKPRPELMGNYLMFDLKKDPLETTNVIDKYPEKAKAMLHDLAQWYDEILHKEKSYQAPQFKIGWNNKTVVPIPAYGPCKIYGNLANADHYLGNWKAKGDRADYQFNVYKPGKYRVELLTNDPVTNTMAMKFSFKGKEVTKELAKSTDQVIGDIDLASGAGIFSVEIINSNNAIIKQVTEIKLTFLN